MSARMPEGAVHGSFFQEENSTSVKGEPGEGPQWREPLSLGRVNARPASSKANSQAHPGRAVFVYAWQLTGV